jgi:hypothetical protein
MSSKTQARSVRPLGRTPVISGRVHESLHRRIQEAAKVSGRTMSEELSALAVEALGYRDRFGSGETRRAIEWLTSTFVMTGEHAAQEKGISKRRWTEDADCRRSATVRLCEAALTNFLSADPEEQLAVVAALKGRVALPLFNPRLSRKHEGGES